jgi:endonuclease/exonuclease/phosphatase family metal-dependent hydrolase
MALRVTTWNLQGRERPDLDVVAAELLGLAPDVVLLQEVQEAQARFLAERLGWSVEWRLKHRPVVVPAEGLAVLAPQPLHAPARVVLASGPFWSSRRRVAVAATIEVGGTAVRVVSTHLGAGVGDEERARQARIVAEAADGGIVGGDMNTRPGSVVLQTFAEHGFHDAWEVVRPGQPGHTNWGPGPRDGAPDKRIDYVLRGPGWAVVGAEVPAFGDHGFERFGPLSDHLPLTVTLEPI